MLDMCRREACADVGEVLIENTDLLGVDLGGAVLVERPPMAKDLGCSGRGACAGEDARWWVWPRGAARRRRARPGKLVTARCVSATDEAVGLAVALGRQLLVETAVEAAAQARFTMARNMRVELQLLRAPPRWTSRARARRAARVGD